MKRLGSKGFTIIELLIATVVFSVVLLVITAAIVQLGKIYYKGTIDAKLQETTTQITEDISQAVQFSKAEVYTGGDHQPGGVEVLCVGGIKYTYIKGRIISDSTPHALVSETYRGGNCSSSIDMNNRSLSGGDNAVELLGTNMQLVDLSAVTSEDLVTVTVRLAYGPDDLLATDKQSCATGINLGGQFCAVSGLITTVTRRL